MEKTPLTDTPADIAHPDITDQLRHGRLEVRFQPQVQISTGKIAGFEIFASTEHPSSGIFSVTDLLRNGKPTGCAAELTLRLVEQALEHLRRWENQGHRGLSISVATHVSAFDEEGVDSTILQLLSRFELGGEQLELEMSEESLIRASAVAIQGLRALRHRGVSIAMGGFGTGRSSLGLLARLPLNCLKLEKTLAQGATSDPSDAMLVRMTCELATSLNLRVVAEGIETEGQRVFFAKLQCELGQGKLFSEPLCASDAEQLLATHHVFQHCPPTDQAARHLLLLDDEMNILRALRRVFRGQSWVVHVANTPDEAFEILARQPIGVVISDQRMPLMRGTEFLTRVKHLHPHTIRMILSGYTELQSVTEAINDGAIYKFLMKPWNDVELIADVEGAFRTHEAIVDNNRLQVQLHETNLLLESRLQENLRRMEFGAAALHVSQEVLSVVPVAIIGIDPSGMVAISNTAADKLLGGGLSIVGELASRLLPVGGTTGSPGSKGPPGRIRLEGQTYELHIQPLSNDASGRGTVATLLPGEQP